MEDTLRVAGFVFAIDYHVVLILVLMEDTLRCSQMVSENDTLKSLNPFCNGGYSQRYLFIQ